MAAWPIPALLALVVLCGGCASPGPLQETPVVSLSAMESIAAEGLEQRYRLRLRIKNPNPEPLPVAGVSFRLVVNGETFADGVSPADVTIEPFSEAVLSVEATSSLYRVYRQLTRMPGREGRPLEWRVEGGLAIRGRLGRIPFEARGELGGVAPGLRGDENSALLHDKALLPAAEDRS